VLGWLHWVVAGGVGGGGDVPGVGELEVGGKGEVDLEPEAFYVVVVPRYGPDWVE
jgi:hypothetical protein